ncbi:hypothetical protein DFP73DRAFT_557849 [Morchella snyderi]|nr:hypothetical protein DFP73DRAFT_557849 [Morchella snyderi]
MLCYVCRAFVFVVVAAQGCDVVRWGGVRPKFFFFSSFARAQPDHPPIDSDEFSVLTASWVLRVRASLNPPERHTSTIPYRASSTCKSRPAKKRL